MTSFSSKIKEKEFEYAYYSGALAFMEGKSMTSPYERGSAQDEDWVDGYLDAMYMRKL